MKTGRLGRLAATGMIACAAAGASAQNQVQPQTIYSQDFESWNPTPEWSNQTATDAPGTVFTRFLGRFSADTTVLTVNLPQPPLRDVGTPGGGGGGSVLPYTLLFDFYCIDSWDGNEPTFGPDTFKITLNTTTTLLDATFSNQSTVQSYPRSPDIGRSLLGFDSRWLDSVYHMSIPFDAPSGINHISFQGIGLQGLGDESWGLDNVRITVSPVPAPGAAGAIGLGAAGMGLRRRRR